jgi:hypothetical protein
VIHVTRVIMVNACSTFLKTKAMCNIGALRACRSWEDCSELSSGLYCRVSLMMEAVRTSETSVDNHFTRQYNPEDSSEHDTRRRENLKSPMGRFLQE